MASKDDPEVLDDYTSSVNEESTEENENADERTEDDTQDPDDPVCCILTMPIL